MSGKIKIKSILVIISLLILGGLTVTAQSPTIFKDSDLDGLSDQTEIETYKTDINKEDTDNDGVLDAQEIIDGTNPNDTNSNLPKTHKTIADSPLQNGAPIMWYIGRMSGVAAFIMFSLVVCMGLMMTSKLLLKFQFLSAPNALEMHSFNATFIGLTLVIAHVISFMFDDVIQLKLSEVLVPFSVQRDIKSTMGWTLGIPISLGIIAFYLALILVLTSQFRRKIVPVKIWRLIHYSSFLFYITFLAHGFFAGTDSKETWMQAIYITSAVLVFSLLLLRVFGKKYFIPKIKSAPVPETVKIEQVNTINA